MDEGARRGVDRLTIQEAARTLRISEGAVRKQKNRGTLKHEKEQDGRIYVYLDTGDRRGIDVGQDEGVDPHNNALISSSGMKWPIFGTRTAAKTKSSCSRP